MENLRVIENEDFQGVQISTVLGQKRKEYIIRLDTAEEINFKAKAECRSKTFIKIINEQTAISEIPELGELYIGVIKEMLGTYCVEVA